MGFFDNFLVAIFNESKTNMFFMLSNSYYSEHPFMVIFI